MDGNTVLPAPKQQITRLLGVTGWTRHHLADLLGVTTFSLSRYASGLRKPSGDAIIKLGYLFSTVVAPLECEITRLRNSAEKSLLTARISDLRTSTPPTCPK